MYFFTFFLKKLSIFEPNFQKKKNKNIRKKYRIIDFIDDQWTLTSPRQLRD